MKIYLATLLALAACSSKPTHEPHVFVLNGLDIPVIVSIESEGGDARLELAPRGRKTTTASGKAKVKVTTKSGALISESDAQLGKPKGCYHVYNVMGAAAYVNEEVVYGKGFGKPSIHHRAGEISERECGVSFAFVEPSDKIAVDKYGPRGDNRGWLHEDGDGGWVFAVGSLLDDTGQWASQSRGKAQRIVRAVVTHDPDNPALPAIKERLTRMNLAIPAPAPGNLLEQPKRKRSR